MKPCLARAFIATTVLLLLATAIRAQDSSNPAEHRDLKLFEFEFGYGLNFAGRWGELKAKPGNNLILDLRLNRPEPFDFGLQLKMGNFVHSERDILKVNSKFIRPSLFFDYNYRFSNFTLFAGVGAGGSFIQNDVVLYTSPSGGLIFDSRANHFTVTPRIGAVVMGVLRITAEYVFTGRDYSCFDINLGLVLGGSYKRTPTQQEQRRKRASYSY